MPDKNNDKNNKADDQVSNSRANENKKKHEDSAEQDVDSQLDFIPGETISEEEKQARIAQLEEEIKQTAESLREQARTDTEDSPSSTDVPSNSENDETDIDESSIDAAIAEQQQLEQQKAETRREKVQKDNERFSDMQLADDVESKASDNLVCMNCQTALKGPYCHECGQPTRHFIRFFPRVLWEMVNEAFDLDSKVFHTIIPLLFKPGRLTMEYIAGRRARYVNPLRLYIIVSIVFFISISAFSNIQEDMVGGSNNGETNKDLNQGVKSRTLVSDDESEAEEQSTLASKGKIIRFDLGNSEVDAERRYKQATKALASLKQKKVDGSPIPDILINDLEEALSDGKIDTDEMKLFNSSNDDMKVTLDDGSEWHPQDNPVRFNDWFSPELTQELNDYLWELKNKAKTVNDDPKEFIEEVFNIIPQLMFLLLPLFALLLKVMYIFKKRYYMEHLIVALHSHSFIFLSGTLIIILSYVTRKLEHVAWFNDVSYYLLLAIGLWIPVNLFLQQKRIYAQGKFMTMLKFSIVGLSYQVLLVMTTLLALVLGLVAL